MNNYEYLIGTVKEIRGSHVIIRMFNTSSQLTYFYNGKRYNGIILGSYIGIKQGQYTIIGQIESETAIDNLNDIKNITFSKDRFIREFTVKVIGAFQRNKYIQGLVAFPQIFNDVILLSDEQIQAIISGENIKKHNSKDTFKIGTIWPNNIDYYLSWPNLFNTHIAIFGNTGSGKSNTLTNLYSHLFKLADNDTINFGESKFVFLDFNGEYSNIEKNTLTKNKKVIALSTSKQNPTEFVNIPYQKFWNKDLLSTIFGATEQTQQPFLSRVLNYYFIKDDNTQKKIDKNFKDQLGSYIYQAILDVYGYEAKQECLDLLKQVLLELGTNPDSISTTINLTHFQSYNKQFYVINTGVNEHGWQLAANGNSYWSPSLENAKNWFSNLTIVPQKMITESVSNKLDNPIFQLKIAAKLQMIHDLSRNTIQYDHLSPLIHRIDARTHDLNKVLRITKDEEMFPDTVTVISLKEINHDIKMLLPMIIAKISYNLHKNTNFNHNKIFNLIIDEAHNILSSKTSSESEKWKDYRLDVFEEIIKEGRKFGYYLTIASQRPADISPTIVSQVHNYFIHRLVNDNDINMLQNTMSSLDSNSRSKIPNLAPGQAIVTGVSFQQPVIIQMDKLELNEQPDSSNTNLTEIWKFKNGL